MLVIVPGSFAYAETSRGIVSTNMYNELSICYFTFSVIVIFLIGIIPQLVKYSPNTILMIVSNPGNKMTSSYKQAFRVMR